MPRVVKVMARRYFSSYFTKDLMAGLTVGVIALPLAMAFAIASGVKPEYGIYSTVTGAALVALFGGCRFQVAGPTGAFIPILLSIVLTYGYQNLLVAGAMAGVILILMGLLKFGSLIKYIPLPVTVGFTAGIAVTIFTGQIAGFLGLTGLVRQESFVGNMKELVLHLDTLNPYSVLTAALCLAIILLTPRVMPRMPGSLVGIVVSTLVATIVYPGEVDTIRSVFGGIPSTLPGVAVPDITLDTLNRLVRPAFTIAILGAIESLLSAVVADSMTGTQHNSNRELIGQGIANLVTPVFGGIPITGAIARTATNIKTGARTQYAAVISALFVLFTLLVLAPYAGAIPLASLAPVLMITAFNMSERHAVAFILKSRSYGSVVLAVTFLLTVLADLTIAVEIGLLLAMVLFVKRMSDMMVVTKVKAVLDDEAELVELTDEDEEMRHDCPQVSIFQVEGPLFFGAAQLFFQSIMDTIRYYPQFIILQMNRVPVIDLTGEGRLRSIVETLHKKGTTVLVAELGEQPDQAIHTTGLYDIIGEEHFFARTKDALRYAVQRVDAAKCTHCDKAALKLCKMAETDAGKRGV